jgi:hypothetical protein
MDKTFHHQFGKGVPRTKPPAAGKRNGKAKKGKMPRRSVKKR